MSTPAPTKRSNRAPPTSTKKESSEHDTIDMLQAELEALAATLRAPSADASKDNPNESKQ